MFSRSKSTAVGVTGGLPGTQGCAVAPAVVTYPLREAGVRMSALRRGWRPCSARRSTKRKSPSATRHVPGAPAGATRAEDKKQARSVGPWPARLLVGARGFEPLTPSASRKCSPPELSARSAAPQRSESHSSRVCGKAKRPRRGALGAVLHPRGAAARLPSARGSGSVGRAQPCQGWGRGFESRLPLHTNPPGRSGNVAREHVPAGPAVETDPLRSPHGDVAKWQGRGLQSPHPRFESGRRLQT